MSRKYREFQYILSWPHNPSFPCYWHPMLSVVHVTINEPIMIYQVKHMVYPSMHFVLCSCMGYGKCITIYTQLYSITQNSFRAQDSPWILPIYLFPLLSPNNSWKPLNFLYCLYSFVFSRCHTVGIVRCEVFLNLLLSLRNIHLRLLHVFFFIAWQLIYFVSK